MQQENKVNYHPKLSKVSAMLTIALISFSSMGSSHREAPNITRLPTVDSTDYYIFNSYEEGRGDYVTMIANYIPLQDAYSGPNYFPMDPAAVYSLHVDTDGDAVEDISFEFDFERRLANDNSGVKLMVGPDGDKKAVGVPLVNIGPISTSSQANANFSESYSISLVEGDVRSGSRTLLTNATDGGTRFSKPLDYIGNKTFSSMQDYEAYADDFIYEVQIPGCDMPARVFVGQRKDPFVVNLGATFDLVNYVPVEGDSAPGAGDNNGFPGGITQSASNDDLLDKNVTSIALEVPKSCITGAGNGVIGSWTTASLPQAYRKQEYLIQTQALLNLM